ncbi:EXS family-domain-containing protein [Lobosporangium transversale]|uniref:EXS family-domain-containing protein n=1 Tax=Lobosporangium transversale TaxID=64571 RepID=A0A1Y2GMV8_9FUNG|nr:EXS family-domain-containing protein [Lobosporangium transversale]ORZ16131.1 EXS family-domain-containing protein [Lobosporangium transversale]|eukprot:XP_021881478.1 EXS family-domain-containing protein [Lobosporangium transversale]
MKFAKYLQQEIVPEWRKAYLNYKQGKKHLKAIESAIKKLETASSSGRYQRQFNNDDTQTQGPADLVSSSFNSTLAPPTGTTPIISQSRGNIKSYDAIAIPTHSSFPASRGAGPLARSLSMLSTALRPSGEDGNEGNTQTSEGNSTGQNMLSVLSNTSRPSRPTRSFSSPALKTMICRFSSADTTERPRRGPRVVLEKELEAATKFKVLKQQLFIADEWKRRNDHKTTKIGANGGWYQAEWTKMRRNIGSLMGGWEIEDVTLAPNLVSASSPDNHQNQRSTGYLIGSSIPPDQNNNLRQRRQDTRQQSVDNDANLAQMILDDKENRRQYLSHKVARTRIKAALYEFHRSLEMIKNYKVLNHTGFVKIMKKYDKTAGWKASKAFKENKLRCMYFMKSDALDDLIKETEDLFIDNFEGGRRRRGMAKLRVPDSKSKAVTKHIATEFYPLIIMCIVITMLFFPLPIAHWSARRWFIQSIGRLIVSGYHAVEFRDFFIADELNSLAYSIEQTEFAICAYVRYWDNLEECATSKTWITPFLMAIPAWFRFMQCLRRYRDTLEWFPHLLNAGKYFSSLSQIFVFFAFRLYNTSQLKALYIVISIFTSLYTYSWDVYMDWGLFRFGKYGGGAYGNPLLRPELVYNRKSVYYLAIVLDFLGRFSWTSRLMGLRLNGIVLSFILALIEVLRRWMWNFFRLENEHLNNCGQFRAIKDIPLPFHIRVAGNATEEEEDEETEDEAEGRNGVKSEGGAVKDSKKGTVRFTGGEEMEVLAVSNGSVNGEAATDSSDRASVPSNGSRKDRLFESSSPQNALLTVPPLDTDGDGAAGVGIGSSSASIRSTGPTSIKGHHRIGLRKRPSQATMTDHSLGVQRSNTVVDNAMTEAGINEDQREQLTSINKFYDRRDFDSRVLDTISDGFFKISKRSNASRAGSIRHGVGAQDPDASGRNRKDSTDDDDTDDDEA